MPQNTTKTQPTQFMLPKKRIHKPKTLLVKVVLSITILTSIIFWTGMVWSLLPRQINFSFDVQSCISQPFLFPGAFKNNNPTYAVNHYGGIKIFNVQLTSSKLCTEPISAPQENTNTQLTLKLFNQLPVKKITVATAKYPSVNYDAFSKPIPPAQPTKLQLDKNDAVFKYRLLTSEKQTNCTVNFNILECPIQNLNLVPGSTNKATLERTFDNHPVEAIYDGNLSMLDPLNIIDGNMQNGNTIIDKPTSYELVFDKPLAEVESPKLQIKNNDKLDEISFTETIQDSKLIITPSSPLSRRNSYVFSIEQATSTGGNVLIDKYSSEFHLSGGPKVIGHNTGTYAYDTNKTMVITFDQELNTNQNFTATVSVVGDGIPAYIITASNKSISINPSGSLPSCTNITIQISSKIQNKYEIDGDSAWKHSFRTLCERTSVIGTSSQGKNIVAHWFGSGPSMILFVGGIHGNKKSSVLTMESWLDELEHYADRIPAGRTIVVITNANPDGYSANSRFNSQGVDLNRNFPSANWSSTVSGPGYTNLANGGGTAPLSAPESSALASFSQQYRPRLVLSFHAVASLVSPNYAGDSEALGRLYASKTSYNFANGSQTDAALGYATTGDYEFWLRDIGIPNILIEQTSLGKNEITKNREALWAMVGL